LVWRRATRAISSRRPWYEPSRSARWQAQGHGGAPKPMKQVPPNTGSSGRAGLNPPEGMLRDSGVAKPRKSRSPARRWVISLGPADCEKF